MTSSSKAKSREAKKLTPKQRVLKAWPFAQAKEWADAGGHCWIVDTHPLVEAEISGRMKSAKSAWADAAKRLP